MKRVKAEPHETRSANNVGMQATEGTIKVSPQQKNQDSSAPGIDGDHSKLLISNVRLREEIRPFIHACIKLLRNQQAIENVQALLNGCTEIACPTTQVKNEHKLYK